jgi:hypothetical protein
MRYVVPFLFSVLLCSLSLPAGAGATISGAWAGSGVVHYRHRVDRIVCRVTFEPIGGKSYRLWALCSTGNDRYEETGRVTRVATGRYSGSVLNTRFNRRGSAALRQRGSRLAVTVTSRRGSASLTLTRR